MHFCNKNLKEVSVRKNPTVQGLVDEYLLSSDFNMLSDKSKLDYQYFLNVMLETKVDSKEMSRIYLKNMTGSKARKSYEVWLNRGISMATYTHVLFHENYSLMQWRWDIWRAIHILHSEAEHLKLGKLCGHTNR